MLGGIVTHPPRRRKDKDGRSRGEYIEKAERAQVDLPGLIDGAGKADRTGGNRCIQVTLPFHGSQRFQIDYHMGCYSLWPPPPFFLIASSERSLSSRTMVLL